MSGPGLGGDRPIGCVDEGARGGGALSEGSRAGETLKDVDLFGAGVEDWEETRDKVGKRVINPYEMAIGEEGGAHGHG